MRILMGSRAIRFHFPDFPRDPVDWDYIDQEKSVGLSEDGNRMETYPIPPLYEIYNPMSIDQIQRDSFILTPDDLYTLKISHAFWDIKWEKTMFDIDFLKSKGAKLDKELFEKLYKYWNDIHGANCRAELAQTKEMFFDDDVMKFEGFEHDDLHKVINPVPTFTKILIDPNGVDVDEKLFETLSDEDKKNLVYEECYVMAYERLAGRDPKVAYRWMVKQFILRHAPFYLAVFAVENYRELRQPKINYKEIIDNELSRHNKKA